MEDEDEGVEASAEEQERLVEEISEFDGKEESHTTAFERYKINKIELLQPHPSTGCHVVQ